MTKKNAIVLINRNSFSYYADGLANVVFFPFPEAVVKDFEIINSDAFEQQLSTFLTSKKIPPSEIAIIYSSETVFFKTFPKTAKATLSENPEIKEFLETVPFEHVIHLEVDAVKNVTFYATNEEFYLVAKRIFEKLLSSVEFVSIVQVTGLMLSNTQITKDQASQLLQKFSLYKQHNMLKNDKPIMPEEKTTTSIAQAAPKKQSKRIYVLGGVFAVLLLVLGIMLWNTFNQPLTTTKKKVIVLPRSTPSRAIVSPTVATATSAAALTFDQINIQLNSNQKSASQEKIVKTQLINNGFKNISEQTGESTSGTTLVVFSTNLPESMQNLILDSLKSIPNNVAVTKNSTSKNTVIITF